MSANRKSGLDSASVMRKDANDETQAICKQDRGDAGGEHGISTIRDRQTGWIGKREVERRLHRLGRVDRATAV